MVCGASDFTQTTPIAAAFVFHADGTVVVGSNARVENPARDADMDSPAFAASQRLLLCTQFVERL
jgi:hypothetical protein